METVVPPMIEGRAPEGGNMSEDASPPESRKVLMVEDDLELADATGLVLRRFGFEVHHAGTWAHALVLLGEVRPDVILLDQHVGPVDTVTRLAELRSLTSVPILVVTANESETDRVLGLEFGADDFVVKPVSGRELVARIRANLRKQPAAELKPREQWHFESQSGRLQAPDGRQVLLTSAEARMLDALINSHGRPVPRDELVNAVYGRDWAVGERVVDNVIFGLRRKLGLRPDDGVIRSIRNVGYSFTGFPIAQR
jgi:DNA-binding response OmpR family regulator